MKNIWLGSSIVALFVILNIFFLSSLSLGQKSTISIYPLKDTFVGDLYPDSNQGDHPWLWVSNGAPSVGDCEAYLYFSLPADYDEYDIIEFHFYAVLGGNSQYFNFETWRVTGDWDEFTITWNNLPTVGGYLFSMTVESHKKYNFNIKELLTSQIFSFVIAPLTWNDLLQIPSSDSTSYDSTYLPAIILRHNIPTESIGGFAVPILIFFLASSIIYLLKKTIKNN